MPLLRVPQTLIPRPFFLPPSQHWDTPLTRTWVPPGENPGTPPTRIGVSPPSPETGYAVGGMPRAGFQQEDLLVLTDLFLPRMH